MRQQKMSEQLKQNDVYKLAAIKLKDIEDAIADYNSHALNHNLYVIGISQYPNEVKYAKELIPHEILMDVYNLNKD